MTRQPANRQRIYLVEEDGADARLVRAATAAQARNHVSRETYAVKVASQEDLIAVLAAGGQVEDVSTEDAATEEPGAGNDPTAAPVVKVA